LKAYKLKGTRQLDFEENRAPPTPGLGELVVSVKATTICGRSDLVYYHYFDQRDHCAKGCFGHEIAGVVAETGPGVTRFRRGDSVFIRTPLTTGFAEYAAARETRVAHLPEWVPFEQGAALQLLPLIVHATRGIGLGNRVLIAGQGPVGLLALQVAKLRGAAEVVTVDLDPWRLEVARQLGADRTLCVRDHSVGQALADAGIGDFDVAIDAVGTQSVVQGCIDALGHHGLLVLLGTHHIHARVSFDLVQWELKALRIHSSVEPDEESRVQALRVAERLVAGRKIDVARLLTHRFLLPELPKAIDLLSASSVLFSEQETARFSGPPAHTLKVAICP
jgi:L-iditol 2-dehydrogenase